MTSRGLIHGLVVDSDWALPGARSVGLHGPPDLRLQRSSAGPRPTDAGLRVAWQDEGQHRHELFRCDQGYVLVVPGVLVAGYSGNGRHACISPAKDVAEGALSLVVSGLVMSTALLLMDEQVLHASAVSDGTRAVAVVGPRGSGKSTTTAMACSAGGLLVSDDQLRVSVKGAGVTCWRSSRSLRLRNGGVGGMLFGGRATAPVSHDGRVLLSVDVTHDEAVELAAIAVPHLDPSWNDIAIDRLDGLEAMAAMLSSRPLPGVLGPDLERKAFNGLADLIERVPVWRLRLPWTAERSTEIGTALMSLARRG